MKIVEHRERCACACVCACVRCDVGSKNLIAGIWECKDEISPSLSMLDWPFHGSLASLNFFACTAHCFEDRQKRASVHEGRQK